MLTHREQTGLLMALNQAAADLTTLANKSNDPAIIKLASAYARTASDKIKQFGGPLAAHGKIEA